MCEQVEAAEDEGGMSSVSERVTGIPQHQYFNWLDPKNLLQRQCQVLECPSAV